ncbi:hypothetical protein NQ315_012908 [Exocentrus adspersus]|uniref:DDE Tnp4 domain-containing protein n=1 Tax=Exocentrus adspersus TaxID=1586481 RepID=A0AAV8VRQ9_9CUCU|nr:hypothetical protein NQ315_012908 [Exocentrus adspersus]
MFDELKNLLEPHLRKTSNRPSIPAECRLLLTLRFRRLPIIDCKFFPNGKINEMDIRKWKRIADDFLLYWNLPNCVGALDGKHVTVKQPDNSGSLFFNYKKTFSVVLFAVCDATYKFTVVDVGAYGSQSDGGVLKESAFGQKLNTNSLNLPEDTVLPGNTDVFPHFFVGDDAFPLKDNLLKPFSGKHLPQNQHIYNYRISRARRCIENTFGVLAAR